MTSVALRTNAPAVPLQRRPKAPDTPWGRLRAARGWSLRDMAGRSGVNPADLSRIERGVGGPTPEQARRLLAVYDVPDADTLRHTHFDDRDALDADCPACDQLVEKYAGWVPGELTEAFGK